jgi:predicted MFS family arabinose efflux permease
MTSDPPILAPRAAAGEQADPRRWLTLVILLLAGFMNLLDVSIVNIAIPSIQRDLHASYADVQWALAGYTLAYALVLITGGLALAYLVRKSKAANPPKLDPGGVALVSAALLLLLYPLVQGRQFGWPTWTFVSMALFAPVFVAFVWYERVKARRDGSPLVPLSLFRDRALRVGLTVAMTFFLGIASFGLVLTLFLQLGLGFTPLHAGLTFLPFSAGVLVSSRAAARLAPKFGRGVTMSGALAPASEGATA